ncbi:2TM domain-containing protein [Nostoc sp.]|uniref:2TM domain-containing protein n=1 Tax=Nostoc sp. TaxID=1180 RepID=UPI002FF9993E
MTYDSEDIQQILQIALAQKQEGEFSHQQLIEMASELNISPQILEKAEQQWLSQRSDQHQQRAFNNVRRQGFTAHLISFLAVNSFLILLNLFTSPSYFWAIFPLLGWGLGLFFHGLGISQNEGKAYEQAFQKWCSQRLPGKNFDHHN